MKRLFIIKNRTHYLVARNYIRNNPKAENYMILTIRKFKGYKDFQEALAQDPDFKLLKVMITDHNFSLWNYAGILATMLKVKKIAKEISDFDEVLFTNYLTWLQHFIIYQFNTKKKILLSDGTRILTVNEMRKSQKTVKFKTAPFGGNKFIIEKILKIKPIENLNIYSPLKIDVAKGDSLDLFQFTSSDSSNINKKKIFFVGSPLVEIGYISQERNLYYLKLLKDKFRDYTIFYFSHPREDKENLDKYNFFGQVVRNEVPFEENLALQDELPGNIISYQSSVLMNLPPAYPDIQFYYIALESSDLDLNPTFRENYKTLMKRFEEVDRTNFQKINFRTPN